MYYWHVSSGTIQREPPSSAAAASSCARFDTSGSLSRSLFLAPAPLDRSCSPAPSLASADVGATNATPPPPTAPLPFCPPLPPSSLREGERERERAHSVMSRPFSVCSGAELRLHSDAPRAHRDEHRASVGRRALDNPFTSDSVAAAAAPEFPFGAVEKATGSVSDCRRERIMPKPRVAAEAAPSDSSSQAARPSSDNFALTRRSKTEPTPSPRHVPLGAPGPDDSCCANSFGPGPCGRDREGGAGTGTGRGAGGSSSEEAVKCATANRPPPPPGSSFYTLCFAPSTDSDDALAEAELLEPSPIDCSASAVPILALQQSTCSYGTGTLNCLEPAGSTSASMSSSSPPFDVTVVGNGHHMPYAAAAVPQADASPAARLPHQQQPPQVVQRAGIGLCTGFMSASVIGVEGLSSMGNLGRARVSGGPSRPGVARLRSCGMHRLSAAEMATREAAQAAVSARILALLRPTPHYRSRTKPALPPASSFSPAPTTTSTTSTSSCTPNGATCTPNGLRPPPSNGLSGPGLALEAEVDCNETDGCHLVLRCSHTQRVVLRESLRTIRFWGIGGPHDR